MTTMTTRTTMTTTMTTTMLGFVLALTWACTDTDREPIDLQTGDSVVFATEVQPYIGLGCGSLDCHGDQGRALRVFAKYGLRSSDMLRGEDASEIEISANGRAFAAFELDPPASHLALLKGLATSAGGAGHEGGDLWATTDAPGYQCLLAYLSGETNPSACAAALAEVDID